MLTISLHIDREKAMPTGSFVHHPDNGERGRGRLASMTGAPAFRETNAPCENSI